MNVAETAERSGPTRSADGLSGFRDVTPVLALTLVVFATVGQFNQLATSTLVDRLGRTERFVGYALGAMTFGAVFGRLIGGTLVDRFGERRGCTVSAAFVVIGGLLYTLPTNTTTFLAGRLIHGLGEAMVYICAATAVMNRVPAHRRSQALGLLGSCVWGGLSVGPAIGELLGRSERAGIVTIFAGLTGLFVARTLRSAPSVAPDKARRLVSFRFPRGSIMPSVTVGLYNIAWASVTGFVILHMRNEGLSPKYALTVYAVSVLFGRLALGSLPDRLGPRPSLIAGLSCMFVGLGVIAIAPSRPLVLLALVLYGVGYSMPFPALASIAVDRTSEAERASTLATLGLVYDVFVFVAGVGFGLLADAGHVQLVMVLGMVGIVAGLALAVRVTKGLGRRVAEPLVSSLEVAN